MQTICPHGRIVAALRIVVTVAGVMFAAGPATRAEQAAQQKPCSGAAYRQFDFWLGRWEVTQNGKAAGKNRIESVLDGCALMESWTGVSGSTGHSLNTYDATRDVWHQTWVDNSGLLLTLEGHLKAGAMVLEGMTATNNNTPATRHRITWTPQPNGDVRQLWQSSKDGERTWQTEFDGLYKRAK